MMIEDKSIDPSSLTTQALWREVQHLKELMETRIESVEKSIAVAHEDSVRVPTEMQKTVGGLEAKQNIKFESIQTQFKERDVRTEQNIKDVKTAVETAFAAQERSGAKSESALMKQIDLLIASMNGNYKALDDKHNDNKDRITRLEGKSEAVVNVTEARRDTTDKSWGYILIAIGLLMTLANLALAFWRK